MSKNRTKITIAVDQKINEKLEENSYNKSKLINFLLDKWLKLDKKNTHFFQKKCD